MQYVFNNCALFYLILFFLIKLILNNGFFLVFYPKTLQSFKKTMVSVIQRQNEWNSLLKTSKVLNSPDEYDFNLKNSKNAITKVSI